MEGRIDAVELVLCPLLFCTTTGYCDSIVLPMKWVNGLYSLNHQSINLSINLIALICDRCVCVSVCVCVCVRARARVRACVCESVCVRACV